MKTTLKACAVAVFAAMASLHGASAASTPTLAAVNLAPTGKLRAAFLGTNMVQGRVDPKTGAVTGPVADMTAELAKRLGVPFELIPCPDAKGVVEALRMKTADIGFLGYDPERAADVDFTGPFVTMKNSYVVPENSALKASTEVDKAGATLGAVKGQTQQIYLSSHLMNAKLKIFDKQPPQEDIEKLFGAGELQGFAMNRQRAIEMDKASDKIKALPDSFLDVEQEFVLGKGQKDKLEALAAFAAEMRGNGFVQAAIDKARLQEAAGVAKGP